MSGVRGDLGALSRAKLALRNAVRDVPTKTAQLAAAPLTGQAQADFAARRTPDGGSWPGSYSLVRKGALRAALVMRQAGRRLSISGLPSYARYQNPRQYIPRGGSRLPATYRAIVDRVAKLAGDLIIGSKLK